MERCTSHMADSNNPFIWPAKDISQVEAGITNEPISASNMKGKTIFDTPNGLAWRRLHHGTAKLKGVHGSAHLLAFFAMEAMVELQVNVPTTCPAWLFSLYAANTVLLIASNIFALMVSTCLLPRMSAISEEYNVADLHEVPTFSPHDRLKGLVSLSAGLAHVFGLFLFLIELILLNWVKFWDFSIPAATAGSITMVPFMILFAISLMHLKKLLAEHKCSFRESKIKEVQTTFKNYL